MRNILNLSWAALILTLLLTGCLAGSQRAEGDIDPLIPDVQAAQTGTVVRIQPADQQLDVNNTTTITVQIDDVANMVAAEVELRFDPAVLQAEDANPNQDGVQWQPNESFLSGFIAINQIDNVTGRANYAVTQLAPFEPVNGSGVLASISFRTVGEGTSDLTFSTVILSNDQVELIPHTVEPGRIVVGGNVTPIPPTDTPTATATLMPGEPTATSTNTPTPSPTSTFGAVTNTPEPTATLVPPTNTPVPTSTSTPIPPTNTPVPPENQIPAGATLGFCYMVQPGDTLYSLAHKYGTDPQFISIANDLNPPGHIYQNKMLFMPTSYGHGPNVYIYETGGPLSVVAEQCKLPVTMLAKYNKLKPEAVLQPGHVLIIPIPPFPPPSRYPYPLPIVPIPPPPK